jgi:hypothetical protein
MCTRREQMQCECRIGFDPRRFGQDVSERAVSNASLDEGSMLENISFVERVLGLVH